MREITAEELAKVFEGKYVNVSPMDHYGITIEMHKGTIEFEDDLRPELYFVSRDDENNVTSSICIDESSIESIEKHEDGTYVIHFSFCMTSINISEYKFEDEELTLIGKFVDEEGNNIQICKDEGIDEMYIDEKSNDPTIVEDEEELIEVSEIGFVSED